MSSCVFCGIVAGTAPAQILREWPDAVAFVPLNPVAPDHTLIVPRQHVEDFTTDPEVSAAVARRAAEFARPGQHVAVNIGAAAGQTVFHLHAHVWSCPRGAAACMPWEQQSVVP